MGSRETRRSGARHPLLALPLLIAFALVATCPAVAAEKAIWGPNQLPNGGSAFPLYHELGVDTVQARLDWATAAPRRPDRPTDPSDPAYNWPLHLDVTITEANRYGIAVALSAEGSPPWANGGRSPIWVPNPQDFADFLMAASRRYPTVARWMIWGEPNKADRFQPNAADSPVAPRAYAPLLDAAYGALKAASPQNIVIGGNTWTGGDVKPAPFLGWMRLPNGQPPRLDWYGHNPFPFRFPNLREEAIAGGWRDISDLDLFSREVRDTSPRRCGRKPCRTGPKLWLSEFNVQSDHASFEFESFVSRNEQARWLSAAFRVTDRLPSVAGMGWLYLLDAPDGPRSPQYGLLTADGSPKPALDAYRIAPSRAFQPAVRVRARVTRRLAARRGISVRVRPRIAGRVVVSLLSARERTVRRTARQLGNGRWGTLRLRGHFRAGHYTVAVDAPRGERVRQPVTVR